LGASFYGLIFFFGSDILIPLGDYPGQYSWEVYVSLISSFLLLYASVFSWAGGERESISRRSLSVFSRFLVFLTYGISIFFLSFAVIVLFDYSLLSKVICPVRTIENCLLF
jgi:hypothetical protein